MKKSMKRILTFLLAAILLMMLTVPAFADEVTGDSSLIITNDTSAQTEQTQQPAETPAADNTPAVQNVTASNVGNARAVIGANLVDDQISLVYANFGIARNSVRELTVTNSEERYYLQGYVDDSVIGTRSISCVYVELLPEGSGMNVTTSNITWCTPEMYVSALATAGITDAKVIVTAPFEVSGTAALTGIYKAYEDITGKKIDELAKAVSTQELTITGELANEIGNMDSTSIVNELKLILDETKNMTDEEIWNEIISIAGEYNVELKDSQINQLITLCRSMEKLDSDGLKQRVEELQGTLKKVSEAKTQVVGFVATVKKVVESVQSFWDKMCNLFGINQ